jgi:hypothetical protein
MRTHTLKTWPEPFQAIVDGRKGFEIRKDDRGFAVGDRLVLHEWDPSPKDHRLEPRGYTGRYIRCRVDYIARGWGMPSDLCVMSLGDYDLLKDAQPTPPPIGGVKP